MSTERAAGVIPQILEQHGEEAAFLWFLRSAAVDAPHYNLGELLQLDGRVEAHLDGWRVGGDAAWALAEASLGAEEPGEVFAAAVLALESGSSDRIERVYDAATSQPELALECGLVSAAGWVEERFAEPFIREGIRDTRPERRSVALRAAGVRRLPIFEAAEPGDWRGHPRTEAAMIRGLGEVGRADSIAHCLEGTRSEDPDVRFWGAWSAALLGSRDGLEILREVAEAGGRHAGRALQLAGRAMGLEDARAWHRALASRPETLRASVQLAGAMGDPGLIPFLLETMAVEAVARVSGESFSMITGIDLVSEGFAEDAPDGFEAGPSDAADDEEVAMDEDGDLPWPSEKRLAGWWSDRARTFDAGQRYLCGELTHSADLRGELGALDKATQRQRAAMAIELALRTPNEALFEVRAVGSSQTGS